VSIHYVVDVLLIFLVPAVSPCRSPVNRPLKTARNFTDRHCERSCKLRSGNILLGKAEVTQDGHHSPYSLVSGTDFCRFAHNPLFGPRISFNSFFPWSAHFCTLEGSRFLRNVGISVRLHFHIISSSLRTLIIDAFSPSLLSAPLKKLQMQYTTSHQLVTVVEPSKA
jgi:hypothetical protein